MTPLQRIAIISVVMTPLLAGLVGPARVAAPPIVAAIAAKPPAATFVLSEAVRMRLARSAWVDPPAEHRAVNWSVGTWENGSCMWCCLMNLLRWQGDAELAEWIPRHRGGGASLGDLTSVLDGAGRSWASGNDESFLEWACRTHRGAIVQWGPGHVVNLVALDGTHAWLMDNTGPLGQKIVPYPRATFLNFWRLHGAWAMTPLAGAPAPPKPWLLSREDE